MSLRILEGEIHIHHGPRLAAKRQQVLERFSTVTRRLGVELLHVRLDEFEQCVKYAVVAKANVVRKLSRDVEPLTKIITTPHCGFHAGGLVSWAYDAGAFSPERVAAVINAVTF